MKSHRSRRQLSPRRFPQCSAAVAALVFACSNQNGDGVPPQENERDASVELSTDTAVSSEATEPSALESELEPLTEDSELEPGSLLAEPNVSSEESGEGATHQSVDGGIDPTESASAAATHHETAQEETGDETTRTETPREETAPDESQPDDTTGVVESSDDSTPSAGAGGVNNSGGAASTAQGGSAGNGGGTGFGGAPGFGGTAGFGGTGLGGNPTIGGMGGTTPSPGPTFGNVHAVLSVWCVPCHDENQREGGRTHGQADIDAAYADIEIIGAEPIAAMVSSRMMPPFDAPNGALTQDQIDLIIAWVNVGAPR